MLFNFKIIFQFKFMRTKCLEEIVSDDCILKDYMYLYTWSLLHNYLLLEYHLQTSIYQQLIIIIYRL